MEREYRFSLKIEPKKAIISIDQFGKILPADFSLSDGEDGLILSIKSENDFELIEQDLYRELDRIFFENLLDIQAEYLPETYVVTVPFEEWVINSNLEHLSRQKWTETLAFQLHLWKLAKSIIDCRLKAILLYQIIEVSEPISFQPTKECQQDLIKECKMIRDWVSHAGTVSYSNLKKFCSDHGIQPVMYDPRSQPHQKILFKKLLLLESVAREIINPQISRAKGNT